MQAAAAAGRVENRMPRPRRIRQQQKQLQWLSAVGAGCVFVLPNRLTALHNANRVESSAVSSLQSRLILCEDAAWQLGQTLLSISRAIKALNLFGLRCEASDKQAIRRQITLYISLAPSLSPPSLSLSLFSNASSLQSRRRQDVPDRQHRYEKKIPA